MQNRGLMIETIIDEKEQKENKNVRDGKSSETKISGIEADFPTKFSPLVDI
jgi:hypothetical protein